MGGGGGGPSSHGRDFFFENSCMKTEFSCTLNAIIRGSLCSGIIPSSFYLFFIFLLNLSQGSIFFFLFFSFSPLPPPPPPFPPFSSPPFFYSPINGGGGGMAPLCPPLSYPSAGYFWHKVNFENVNNLLGELKIPGVSGRPECQPDASSHG